MEPLAGQLHETLELLDQAYREGKCGTQLMVECGELYEMVDLLGELHLRKLSSITKFVTEDTPLWFQSCEEFYAKLYLMVYTAMEKSRQQQPPLKLNGVPIDPQCPLNIIDTTTASKMTILLHNDNETLAKYPPSSLYRVQGIAPKITELEIYYESQCSLLHETYLSSYDEILDSKGEWEKVDMIREKVVFIIGLCGNPSLSPLKESLMRLDVCVSNLLSYQERLASNCTQYRNNVLKWFMVAVQLKDNMLKSYNLSNAHQKSGYISSVF
jgi:hypothetical protein